MADNAWKAGTADSNDTASGCEFASGLGICFTDRKLAAVRAYHEWMPIRQVQADDKLRIWRNFPIGRLLDLTMLDTRQYDRDITDVSRHVLHICKHLEVFYRFTIIRNVRDSNSRNLYNEPLLTIGPEYRYQFNRWIH